MTFNQLFNLVSARKVPFVVVFFVAVSLTYGVLYAIDFIPEPISEENSTEESAVEDESAQTSEVDENTTSAVTDPEIGEVINDTQSETAATNVLGDEIAPNRAVFSGAALPTEIVFESLDRTVTVLNPQSSAIPDLDAALLKGAVRHPESANFAEDGNMFILAHSSYLPNVMNHNFQAFNGIQKLAWGDQVRVRSADMEYVYRVEKVYEAKASEVFVPHTPGEARLTLATCNSFGSKDDRFVVEAELVGSYRIIGEGTA